MATTPDPHTSTDTSGRGFAAMDDDRQREIARKGGQSVKPEDRSFANDPDLAAEAGRKGGEASHGGRGPGEPGRGGNFADDRERAADAGRRGGRS